MIDKKLGGTAPLDIIISAPESALEINEEFEEDFDDFGIETEEYGYWFNSQNLSYLEEIRLQELLRLYRIQKILALILNYIKIKWMS